KEDEVFEDLLKDGQGDKDFIEEFIFRLIEIVQMLSKPKSSDSVHFYVTDDEEMKNLREVVLRAAFDHSGKLNASDFNLLAGLLFDSPEFLAAGLAPNLSRVIESSAKDVVKSPITSILSALTSLYAIPAVGYVTFQDAVREFLGKETKDTSFRAGWKMDVSSKLRSRTNRLRAIVDKVRSDIRVRKDLAKILVFNASPLEMPEPCLRDGFLSRLMCFTQTEVLEQRRKLLLNRMKWHEICELEPCEYTGTKDTGVHGFKYRVISGVSQLMRQDVEKARKKVSEESNGFKLFDWLIVDAEAQFAALQFDDIGNMSKFYKKIENDSNLKDYISICDIGPDATKDLKREKALFSMYNEIYGLLDFGALPETETAFRIFVSAFTKAAIDTFTEKFRQLIADRVEFFSQTGNATFDEIKEIPIIECRNYDQSPDTKKLYSVTVGTVWALGKLYEKKGTKATFDMLLLDEASQIPVSYGLIFFQCLGDHPNEKGKRIVLAGDSRQFRPILHGQYPSKVPISNSKDKVSIVLHLFGSILDFYMNAEAHIVNTEKRMVMMTVLKENFRFLQPLCRLTERLYGKTGVFEEHYRPSKLIAGTVKTWLDENHSEGVSKLGRDFLNAVMEKCMITVSIGMMDNGAPFWPIEQHYRAESRIVKDMVFAVRRCLPDASIFVVTPHRAQKGTIIEELGTTLDYSGLRIDTTERMQGGEADIVFVCLGFTNQNSTFSGQVDFIYNINRINVALSRPRSLCVLIGTPSLFKGDAKANLNVELREGVEHLNCFKEQSLLLEWQV
ncbi:hypothetical protein HDU67_007953, partial [Dinochytrium kinnereticum]